MRREAARGCWGLFVDALVVELESEMEMLSEIVFHANQHSSIDE